MKFKSSLSLAAFFTMAGLKSDRLLAQPVPAAAGRM